MDSPRTEARCDALRLDDRQDGLLAWAKGGEVAGVAGGVTVFGRFCSTYKGISTWMSQEVNKRLGDQWAIPPIYPIYK